MPLWGPGATTQAECTQRGKLLRQLISAGATAAGVCWLNIQGRCVAVCVPLSLRLEWPLSSLPFSSSPTVDPHPPPPPRWNCARWGHGSEYIWRAHTDFLASNISWDISRIGICFERWSPRSGASLFPNLSRASHTPLESSKTEGQGGGGSLLLALLGGVMAPELWHTMCPGSSTLNTLEAPPPRPPPLPPSPATPKIKRKITNDSDTWHIAGWAGARSLPLQSWRRQTCAHQTRARRRHFKYLTFVHISIYAWSECVSLKFCQHPPVRIFYLGWHLRTLIAGGGGRCVVVVVVGAAREQTTDPGGREEPTTAVCECKHSRVGCWWGW